MVKLPAINECQTLSAMNKKLEEIPAEKRSYLGMSGVGYPCQHSLWLAFRWVNKVFFSAETIKKFEDGHVSEKIMFDRLKKVVDIYGSQEEFSDFNGHFKGHADQYMSDSFTIEGDPVGYGNCPGTFGQWSAPWYQSSVAIKKNTMEWGITASVGSGLGYFEGQIGDLKQALETYYRENTTVVLKPEWRVNENYELWSTVKDNKIYFNQTPWGITIPSTTSFMDTIRELSAPKSITKSLDWENAVPVYYQIIPGATYYFKNGQKYPDPITNYYSDYSMFAWYFPGTRDPNPERFRQHSKNWWSGFNKNGIVMGHWNPCLYSKATPGWYKYYGPNIS